MARGLQKEQSQAKNAAKAKAAKSGSKGDRKASAAAALIYSCAVCRSQMNDLKTYKQHFESKHSKAPLPEELKEQPAA